MQKLLSFYRNNQKTIRLVAFLSVMILFIVYAANNWAQFARFKDVKLWQIILIIIGQLTILFSSTLMFMHVAKVGAKGLSFNIALRINTYSALVNFFGFLQGGVGVRAAYLKIRQEMTLKKFFLITLVQYFTLFYLSGSLIAVSILFLNDLIIPSIALMILGLLFVPFLYRLIIKTPGIKSINLSHGAFYIFFAINAIQLLGCFIAYGTELFAIGSSFSFWGIVLYSAITQFAIVLAITPGALGIKEFLLLTVSAQMGLSLDDIILSSTLDRLVLFITFIIILPVAFSMKDDLLKIRQESENKVNN